MLKLHCADPIFQGPSTLRGRLTSSSQPQALPPPFVGMNLQRNDFTSAVLGVLQLPSKSINMSAPRLVVEVFQQGHVPRTVPVQVFTFE